MSESSRLVNIENCQYPRATFSDGTKLHTLNGDTRMENMLCGKEWTLFNGLRFRKVSVCHGMLLTDFLAVLTYLEGK